MTGQAMTARQPLERMAGGAQNGFPREETLYMDGIGCIPFSVRGARAWRSTSLHHPARIELYDRNVQGSEKIGEGAVFMRFPDLRYEAKGERLIAILGDPEFIG